MLGNTKGKLINQYVPDYVLYDLETTGTSSKYDEVIEISAVKVKKRRGYRRVQSACESGQTDSQRGKCSKSYHG